MARQNKTDANATRKEGVGYFGAEEDEFNVLII
jgi:hypothetical protein